MFLAYPEEEGADLGPEPSYSGGYGGGSMGIHLEGLIPLILIIVIAAVAGSYLGLWNIPLVSQAKPLQVLVIGEPSLQARAVMDEAKDLVNYRVRSAESLRASPREQLAQYDIVLLDQQGEENHCIPRQVGEAVREFVLKGGKLITVMDSGICRSGSMEAIGWKAVMGDVVPADCAPSKSGQPSCVNPIVVRGEIWRQDYDHPIMQGIEVIPALQDQPLLELVTFDVVPQGNEIAFIQNASTPEFYPAIVEKRLVLGKSIYFNYDPGATPVVMQKTFEYLR